ncbi:MAG: hypothetical protein K8R46_09060 [Pirellulales bacterium]|nr:hypothetical protein [Pirellulales bacterium]
MVENFRTSQRDVKTAIPIDTTEIPIRRVDWSRIYRKVKNIPKHNTIYVTAAGSLFGLGATALLSLIPLYQSAQSLDAWVKPAYWIIGLAGIVLVIITYYFAKESEDGIQSSCKEVQQDMKEVHSIFFPDDDLDKEQD